MTSLLSLVLNAPLVGVRKRWPGVLHAIDMDGLPMKTWPKGKATSACGLTGLRVTVDQRDLPVPWPPRVSTIPDGKSRCQECYTATGKPRPRSEYRAKADA